MESKIVSASAVPADQLASEVQAIANEMMAPGGPGFLTMKETLNTDLEMMGVGAMFRVHGHMNALTRLDGDR